MATWMVHLRIADGIMKEIPQTGTTGIYYGEYSS